MATLLLSTAGAAIGNALMPAGGTVLGMSGATLGSLAGAVAGSYIDQALFGATVAHQEGPRLSELTVMTSSEGAPVPRAYGRVRLSGQVIWATRFRETVTTVTSGGHGGKGGGGGGGASTTSYSYSVSFAVSLCEGPVTRIGRVWADGNPLDLTGIEWRLHQGGEGELPDPLIEAVEGTGNVPAYRGTAYVVFEDMALAAFGNRLPQLSFEIFRGLGDLETRVKAVTLIPGASEFAYDTQAQRIELYEGVTSPVNVHNGTGKSDYSAALDQLQATCPHVEAVSLVAAWFGSDLRCGACTIEPRTENATVYTVPDQWKVGGLIRGSVNVVSLKDGLPAYGGTPSDQSVIRAIRDLSARGLAVTFYPFVMMDVPEGNGLPDPYVAGGTQGAYPWRGRITCHPAPGVAGSPDKTAGAAAQVAAFFGTAGPGQFTIVGEEVRYTGAAEWSYRRMILHYAHLCALAGGVETFLIGSELRGLVQVRSAAGSYPAVAALKTLAQDVRSILGPGVKISYAADWSEYGAHQPGDGSGDLYFPLDPLWADSNIDFVGIDNYLPLSDWRDGSSHLDATEAASIYDPAYLRRGIEGGENYDWYYASDAARAAQSRTPITDGAYGKPWVWRAKDIRNWWAQAHYNRPGGVESGAATAWTPQSKPIRFTEFGCPAVDKGTNQPNVFVDPKSSESALPHFSNGSRDDMMQRAYLDAMLGYWQPDHPAYDGDNPISSVYGGYMIEPARMAVWTWDARPFPAFPNLTQVWADGGNWRLGHWLNGRLGAAPLADLVAAILSGVGFARFDVSGLSGLVDGYVIDRIMSPRQALEPLMLACFFDAVESEGVIRFRHLARATEVTLSRDGLVEGDGGAAGFSLTRGQESELPLAAKFLYIDGDHDYRQASVEARRQSGGSLRVSSATLPIVMTQELGQRSVDVFLQKAWRERERATLKLPPSLLALDPGDVVALSLAGDTRRYRLTEVTDETSREAAGVISDDSLYSAVPDVIRPKAQAIPASYGTPVFAVLDLPILTGTETPGQPVAAGSADPWPGAIAVYRDWAGSGLAFDRLIDRQAVMGRTLTTLMPGPVGRWDEGNRLEVRLVAGSLSSIDALTLLNGGNVAALETPEGDVEIIQFRDAMLTGANQYRLSGLLRGQAGTEAAMETLAAGARFVLLGSALAPLSFNVSERGLARSWRYGPAPRPSDDVSYAEVTKIVTGVGLRPLSPCHLKGARLTGGDINLSWIRRTRIDGDSWQGLDVPLGEESEAYELDILDGANVVRTLSVTSPGAIYSATQQIADFGSSSFPTLSIRVCQLSRSFGRGTARGAILNV
ncbi:MAG: glycoside hydrolase/phage tail family protein [Parvibaculaceae bacterium]|nr:glycoside hydrolase/phage tail family protein [Parvibaculaceae bacterium]